MHSHSIGRWQHHHTFLSERHERRELRTWFVVALSSGMMIAEIVGGTVFGSMALVADGWHMCTHVAALSIAGLAYFFARRHAHNPRFSFGTGKLGDLAGFASALMLGLIALLIGYESVVRLTAPVAIQYDEAILVAALGLLVNLASALLLKDDHHVHGDEREHHTDDRLAYGSDHPRAGDHQAHDDHHHAHVDHNLRAAYVHVLADALTSVLAICALLLARFFGWTWVDPAMGLVGAGIITAWSVGLIRASALVLLDTVPNTALAGLVRERLEQDSDRVADLHLWRVGPGHTALVVTLVSDAPQPPSVYKDRLHGLRTLSHVTVEVHPCEAPAHDN